MNVRLENIHNESSPANYVSFLHQSQKPPRGRSDRDSVHSVSSVRSVMSGMTAFWSSIGLGYSTSASKSEKAKAAVESDLKYLYSAFTKLPALRFSPDYRARLIQNYEEFPFDTAVPLFAFKNVQQLDIIDIDFRQFFGWDRLADQLTLLTLKRANIDDPTDLLTNIVLDDADRRRRRSAKSGFHSPTSGWAVPSQQRVDICRSHSDPGSPVDGSQQQNPIRKDDHEPFNVAVTQHYDKSPKLISGSISPNRPTNSRPTTSYRHVRTYSTKAKRSGSGSSNSSEYSVVPHRSESSSNLLSMSVLPASKWQRLKYLSLADNSLTSLSAESLQPLANTLRSLNLSSNLFTEVPDCLALLTRLSSLDLSHCMIASLHSLERNPLPAILTLKLKSNRLQSLAGVQRLLSLENLNVQANRLSDPTEAARLTGIPNLNRIWVKQNPFTKRSTDYRITIFNLFRSTPGFTEDIVIDDSGPGYSERKSLIDRVSEIQHSPHKHGTNASSVVQRSIRVPAKTESIIPQQTDLRPQLSTSQSDFAVSSTRRKKAPRRRMVELSRDDGYGPTSGRQGDHHNNDAHSYPTFAAIEEAPAGNRKSDITKCSGVVPDGCLTEEDRDIHEQPIDGDYYRKKVEALRREFGNNWISVLREQSWGGANDGLSNPSIHFAHQQANSQVAVDGGRPLG